MACVRFASSLLLLIHTIAGDRQIVKQRAGSNHTLAGTAGTSLGFNSISDVFFMVAVGMQGSCSLQPSSLRGVPGTLLQTDAQDDLNLLAGRTLNSSHHHYKNDRSDNDIEASHDVYTVNILLHDMSGTNGDSLVLVAAILQELNNVAARAHQINICDLSDDQIKNMVPFITNTNKYHTLIDVLLISAMSPNDHPTTETASEACDSYTVCNKIHKLGFMTQCVGDSRGLKRDGEPPNRFRKLLDLISTHLAESEPSLFAFTDKQKTKVALNHLYNALVAKEAPIIMDLLENVVVKQPAELTRQSITSSTAEGEQLTASPSQKLFALVRGKSVHFYSQVGLAKWWKIQREESLNVKSLFKVFQSSRDPSALQTASPNLLTDCLTDFTDMMSPLTNEISIFRLDPV